MTMKTPVTPAAEQTIAYLSSPAARESLAADAYWPKWDSPWWHMSVLYEIGLAERIPAPMLEAMVAALNSRYLRVFPFDLAEVPDGINPVTQIMCHCGLGNMYQILAAAGVDVAVELSWVRPWFLTYQMPDGGLNCDEAAYLKDAPKSSIVSTAPALEAMLLGTASASEERFLGRGFEYLLNHRLVRSTKGRVIDEAWLSVSLPRFYFYDILRGLHLLLRLAARLNREIPGSVVAESVAHLESAFPDGRLFAQRRAFLPCMTRTAESNWAGREPVSVFPLLTEVSDGAVSEPLCRQWADCLYLVEQLQERHLIVA